MTGRVIIVTGASSGIGYETARFLAEGGNDVILACRDESRGEEAVRKIKEKCPNSLVTFMQLNLASAESIKDFVKRFTKRKKKLSVLINNAAIQLNSKDMTRKETSDGYEVTLATNYLGPFLLTNLLLDYLIQTSNILGDSRIINVSCAAHDHENSFTSKGLDELDVGNLCLSKAGTYSSKQAYKNSKLCDVLFTYSLAEKLKDTHVVANAVDPGFVPTSDLQRHASRFQQVLTGCCMHKALGCTNMTKSVKSAAQQIADIASSDKYEYKTGKYFKGGIEDRSSIESYDSDLQRQLWRETCRLLNYTSSVIDEDLDKISLSEREEQQKPLLNRPI